MQSKKVLVADDSPDDRLILAATLGRTALPFELFEVEDGEEVISFLSHQDPFSDPRRSPRPDLLLLDLKMPGKDGFEVLEWIRDHPYSAPGTTVVLSGSQLPADMQRAAELGAAAYLGKPATVERLRSILAGETGQAQRSAA